MSEARILFTGQYWPGANTVYIANAFERCGATVHLLNDTNLYPEWRGTKGKIARRLLHSVIESEWNRQLLDTVTDFNPDLVYVTNADLCWPKTLETIRKKNIPVMCFYHDVPWRNVRGCRFAENISHFDLIATTRSWQEPEFKNAGAKEVKIVRFGYEPEVHRPLTAQPLAIERYGADITFIGSYRPHRAAQLERLVESDFPYSFRIWGGGWENLSSDSALRSFWQNRLVQESEIPVIYATSKIALHWLMWEPNGNDPTLQKGDQHNSRTFQIAACGGAMMLAQRTDQHRQFFTEDIEAVFFDDVDELREKLAYWIDGDDRKDVAAAARERCLTEDYSYVPVVRGYLEHFGLD